MKSKVATTGLAVPANRYLPLGKKGLWLEGGDIESVQTKNSQQTLPLSFEQFLFIFLKSQVVCSVFCRLHYNPVLACREHIHIHPGIFLACKLVAEISWESLIPHFFWYRAVWQYGATLSINLTASISTSEFVYFVGNTGYVLMQNFTTTLPFKDFLTTAHV